jgi:hypothetical protein
MMKRDRNDGFGGDRAKSNDEGRRGLVMHEEKDEFRRKLESH